MSAFVLRSLGLFCALLALGTGCGAKDDSAGGCDASGATAGQVTGTLSGAAWSSPATWSWSGESLQINTDTTDGWRMTLVAHRDIEGRTLAEIADSGGFPAEVNLGADDGWALLYPEAGSTSLSSKEGSGGSLVLSAGGTAAGTGAWVGCLDFGAASADGSQDAVLEGGLIDAVPL
jgi:hypothetical protein